MHMYGHAWVRTGTHRWTVSDRRLEESSWRLAAGNTQHRHIMNRYAWHTPARHKQEYVQHLHSAQRRVSRILPQVSCGQPLCGTWTVPCAAHASHSSHACTQHVWSAVCAQAARARAGALNAPHGPSNRQANKCVRVHVCAHARTDIHALVSALACECMMRACVHACMCARVHVYVHACTHTHHEAGYAVTLMCGPMPPALREPNLRSTACTCARLCRSWVPPSASLIRKSESPKIANDCGVNRCTGTGQHGRFAPEVCVVVVVAIALATDRTVGARGVRVCLRSRALCLGRCSPCGLRSLHSCLILFHRSHSFFAQHFLEQCKSMLAFLLLFLKC